MKTDEIVKKALAEFDLELKDMRSLAVNHDKRLYEAFARILKSALERERD